jgi:DNA uptake protein ComE-like DNA-binding protein
MNRSVHAAFAAILAVGCQAEIDPEAAPSQYALTLSTVDSARVLDLVNYPGVTVIDLDGDAGLDVRAAENIHAHRAGADGEFPSADDNLFDDIAELDSVSYVGDVAFERLRAYATAHPAPAAESVEGVLFRGWESESVTWGVNYADAAALDALLDARAAASLIAGRPFTNVTAMGPMSYVGGSALERLRSEAPAWWRARAGVVSLAGTFDGVAFDDETARVAIEIANDATHAEMVANGVYSSGAAVIAGNRPYTGLAQIAALSGVGTSTMRGLHDYAASGAWSPEPVDPGPVDPPPPVMNPPDASCVFGTTYRDIGHNGATVIIARRVLDPSSSTNATQRAQIVAAVQAAYEHVATVTQAFLAVDQNEIHHVELYDASNRRPYTAYEYGAGDNSYGLVFEHGTTNVAARIQDGDLYGCTTPWGDEMRDCPTTDDCAEGLACVGMNPDVMSGRCVDVHGDHFEAGSQCSVEAGCLPGYGLVCAGARTRGEGICVPAWMRGYFDYFGGEWGEVAVPDNGSVALEVPVYGLASVDADVVIDLVVSHPRISDLRITLTNPATAEVVVFDGAGRTGAEVALRDHVVRGFSGDEMVNGAWTLRVTDRATGSTATVHRFALTITSRFD